MKFSTSANEMKSAPPICKNGHGTHSGHSIQCHAQRVIRVSASAYLNQQEKGKRQNNLPHAKGACSLTGIAANDLRKEGCQDTSGYRMNDIKKVCGLKEMNDE